MKNENSQLIKDLEALYALLSQPYAWCKGEGIKVEPRAPEGFAWCLTGGCSSIAATQQRKKFVYQSSIEIFQSTIKNYQIRKLALERALGRALVGDNLGVGILIIFNDSSTTRKRDVLKLIRDTIDLVKT
jgi:hypothetical protein